MKVFTVCPDKYLIPFAEHLDNESRAHFYGALALLQFPEIRHQEVFHPIADLEVPFLEMIIETPRLHLGILVFQDKWGNWVLLNPYERKNNRPSSLELALAKELMDRYNAKG